MYFEKPINIQLFADDDNENNQNNNNENQSQSQTNQSNSQNTNMVSKELYDKTASEVADLKKQLRELQKNGKSEAELKDLDIKEKDAELQKRNEELNKLYVELNRANAKSILAETQAKFNLKDASLIETAIESIVTNDGELTKQRADNLNKLLNAVYEKAVSDVKSNEWSSMANGVKSGGNTSYDNKKVTDFVKSIMLNQTDTNSIKDKFK